MNFKKILSIILTLVLTMGTVSLASAEGLEVMPEIPDGFTPIYTAEDLNNIRNNLSGKYILMNDIDLSVYENWVPIGTRVASYAPPVEAENIPFTGILDGNGFNINNLKIEINADAELHMGLFGYIENGAVKNLSINNGIINVKASQAIRVGFFSGAISGTDISNCKTSGEIRANVLTNSFVGGLVGESYTSSNNKDCFIAGCENSANIIVTGELHEQEIGTELISCGGIVGSATTSVSQCANHGSVNVDISEDYAELGQTSAGGISGFQFGNLTDCYNSGSIQLKANYYVCAGGITGIWANGCDLKNVHAVSYVSAASYDDEATIGCDALIGDVEPVDSIDDIFGILENLYYLDTLYSNINDAYNEIVNYKSLSAEEYRKEESFIGFDFENIWVMDNEIGYPVLRELVEPENPPEDNPGEDEPIVCLTNAEIIKVPFGKRIVFGTNPESPEGIEIKLTYSNGDIITDTVRLSDDRKYYVGTEIVQDTMNSILNIGRITTYGINEAEYFLGNGNARIAYKYLALPSIVEFFKNIIF